MTLLGLDFETYYDSECTLRKLSPPEYVAHPDFHVQMAAVTIDDSAPMIIPASNMAEFLREARKEFDYIKMLCHRAQFDGWIAHHIYDWHPDEYVCTESMSRGWWSSERASLEHLCVRIWPNDPTRRKGDELSISKGVKHLEYHPELFPIIGNYAKNDIWLCREAYYWFLEQGYPAEELEIINDTIAMACKPILRLNRALIQRAADEGTSERDELIADSGIPGSLEEQEALLGSNKKFPEYLELLGIDTPMKQGKNGPIPALGKNDLQFTQLQEENPHLTHLWEARIAAKSNIAVSRANRFLNICEATNDECPVALLYSGAHTHRMSGTWKLNQQNLPAGRNGKEPYLRLAMEAPADHSVLVRDLSAIEPRVLATISNHTTLLDIFTTGGDPYCWFATERYRREITKADWLERAVGKACILGLGYGMGWKKFWGVMNAGPLGMPPIPTSERDAQETVGIYREVNYPITNYWGQCNEVIGAMMDPRADFDFGPFHVTHETLWSPCGLPIRFKNLRHHDGNIVFSTYKGPRFLWGGSLTENVIQHLARVHLMQAHLRFMQKCRELEYRTRFVLQVHDEPVYVVPNEHVEHANELLAIELSRPPVWMPGVPLASEGGWSWRYDK